LIRKTFPPANSQRWTWFARNFESCYIVLVVSGTLVVWWHDVRRCTCRCFSMTKSFYWKCKISGSFKTTTVYHNALKRNTLTFSLLVKSSGVGKIDRLITKWGTLCITLRLNRMNVVEQLQMRIIYESIFSALVSDIYLVLFFI